MLGYLQFPWRFLGVIILSCSFLAAFIFQSIRGRLLLIVPFFILLVLFNKDYAKGYLYFFGSSSWYQDQPFKGTTTAYSEHTPLWQKTFKPRARIELLDGRADITNPVWKTNYHLFQVNALEPSLIQDQTVYFPGWTVFVDNRKVANLGPYDKRTGGLITLPVPAGEHKVEVKLLEPPIHRLANYVSLASLVLAGFLLLYNRFRKLRVW